MKKVQDPARQRAHTTLLPRARWIKMTTATIVPAIFIAGGIMAAVNPAMWEVQSHDQAPDVQSQPVTPPPTTTPLTVDKPEVSKKTTKVTATPKTATEAHQRVVAKREVQAEKQRQQAQKTGSESKAAESIIKTVNRFQERLLSDHYFLPSSLNR